MGSPSAYFVFAVPQDGIAAPADFNGTVNGYLRKIWDGTATGSGAGTLTGPDGSGFYTVTLTGVTIPDNAVMLTGGMGYSYSNTSTQPLTQTNLSALPGDRPGGGADEQEGRPDRDRAQRPDGRHRLHRPARDRRGQALQRLPPGARHVHQGRVPCRAAQRRHDLLVVPHTRTGPAAAGRRTPPTSCTRSTASAKRRCPSTGTRRRRPRASSTITYPGILNDCLTCHLPGTFDFSATPRRRRSAAGSLRTVGQGTYSASVSLSPYVAPGTELRQRVLLQRDQRRHHRGGADDPRDVADGGGMLRLPRLDRCHLAHEEQHRLVLRGAQRGARRQRDLPGLPRHRPDGGHRGRALEEPLSTSEAAREGSPARRPGRQQEDRDAAELDGDDRWRR